MKPMARKLTLKNRRRSPRGGSQREKVTLKRLKPMSLSGSKSTVSKLKKKADVLFSLAVRLRDADEYGVGSCITCGSRVHYKQAHAGHFMSRRYSATRYEPENVNLQCVRCNTFNSGEQYKYSLALDLKYGVGTAKKLHDAAHADFKLTRLFLEQVIHDAKEEIKWYENN